MDNNNYNQLMFEYFDNTTEIKFYVLLKYIYSGLEYLFTKILYINYIPSNYSIVQMLLSNLSNEHSIL